MSHSRESIFAPILVDALLRTVYGYVLVAVVGLVFPLIGLGGYASSWYWLLIPAVILHGLYVLSAYNDPAKLAKIRDRRSGQDEIKLDSTRLAYLADVQKRREIIDQRISQVKGLPAFGAEISSSVAELDRLIPEVETLLKRNQRLEGDIKRLDSAGATARPSQESLKELQDLYGRQWDVIKRVTAEIATLDANLAVVVNQVDSQEDSAALEAEAKQWNTKLGYWKESIREVYG